MNENEIKLENVFLKEFKYLIELLKSLKEKNYLLYKWMILSGSRKAGKTYALIDFLLLAAIMLSSRKNEKTLIVITRHKSVQIKDIWKQFEYQMKKLGLFNYFRSNKTANHMWSINENVDIFFRSVFNPQGDTAVKGLPRLNYENAFIVFDESDQMSQAEIDAMIEAVEAQHTLPIWLFNPNSADEYIVGRANKLVPEDEDIMIKGSGSHFTEVKNEVGQLGVVHRVNYKINKYLSAEETSKMMLQAKVNPRRARTAVYGLTGNAGDRSYMDFNINRNVIPADDEAQYFLDRMRRVSHYTAGVDFGTTVGHSNAMVLDVFYENSKFGATAAEWGWENDSLEGVPIYEIENRYREEHNIRSEKQWVLASTQKVFSEHLDYLASKDIKVYKDNERLARELLNKIEALANKVEFSNMKRIGLKMKVDPGGGGKSFLLSIKKEIAKRGLHWIKAKTAKKAKVDFRQQFGNDLFANGWKIGASCKNLINEVSMAKNDEDKRKLGIIQREKKNDNYLDPWDYAKEGKFKRLNKTDTTENEEFYVYNN